MLENPLSDTK